MFKIYYRVWADAIVAEQAKKVEKRNWKLYTLIPMSIVMGINLLTFFYWMKVLVNRNLPLFIGVNIFNAKPINSFISVVCTFIIPFIILNYLIVFNNDIYNYILHTYHAEGGKLYRKYVLYSLGLCIIPVLIKVMFF
ncbi:hypothetical protein [Mucilaginibacter sp.]|uniref:hypothetical protein n=1 Tax=Mucilaginibacter sp. TaxID=1882438 RepID=UPI003D0A2BEC